MFPYVQAPPFKESLHAATIRFRSAHYERHAFCSDVQLAVARQYQASTKETLLDFPSCSFFFIWLHLLSGRFQEDIA